MTDVHRSKDQLIQRFGDAAADVIEQMIRGKWRDDHDHDVQLNVAMVRLKEALLAAVEMRSADTGKT